MPARPRRPCPVCQRSTAVNIFGELRRHTCRPPTPKIVSTSVHLTADNYLRLRKRAREARMTLSGYLNWTAFGPPANPLDSHRYWRKDAR